MTAITTNRIAPTANFATAEAAAPQSRDAAEMLARINQRYPNLDADIEQAREDVASTENADKWAGLKWYEKAVFFVPPFGPLIGVMMMSANKDMHRNAVNKLDELEQVATVRADLQAQVRSSATDRFER